MARMARIQSNFYQSMHAMKTMNERPILFSGEMVRAILGGQKTQTRRIAKLSSSLPDGKGWVTLVKPGTRAHLPLVDGKWQWKPAAGDDWQPYPDISEYCPYGRPGDRLWVRETWAAAISPSSQDDPVEFEAQRRGYIYRADCAGEDVLLTGIWKPSIHMPRKASRLMLEITGVRIERLQDISEADALAEGIEVMDREACLYRHYGEPFAQSTRDDPRRGMVFSPVDSYETLWTSINGAGSWEANPWVWVVEFNRVAHA